MSVHKLAKLTGYIFILIGILGFIPGITHEGLLVGFFAVDSVHNLFHIATGVVALLMSQRDQKFTRYFFQIIGLVYLALALIGFAHGDAPLFTMMAHNKPASWLHLAISVAFLYIGFLYRNHRSK